MGRSLGRRRLATFAVNYLPLLHAAAVIVCGIIVGRWSTLYGVLTAIFVLYVAPPIAARIVIALFPFKNCVIGPDSREFVIWWLISCIQGVFNRFPFLDEALRLIPTVYSNWLRLWGSRIGKLAFWAPGVLVLDRTHLVVGNEVLFGAGVRITPHIMARGSSGEVVLLLSSVTIGDSASLGGYSLLGPGTVLAPGETTRAFFISPPFSSWSDGKRTKIPVPGWEP